MITEPQAPKKPRRVRMLKCPHCANTQKAQSDPVNICLNSHCRHYFEKCSAESWLENAIEI